MSALMLSCLLSINLLSIIMYSQLVSGPLLSVSLLSGVTTISVGTFFSDIECHSDI